MKLVKTYLSRAPDSWSYSVAGFVLLVFLGISLVYWNHPESLSILTAEREAVLIDHEGWRLFSSLALHADIRHFLSNAMFFFIFAMLLNGYFGWWVFPWLSLLLGAASNWATLYFYPEHASLIGASGMVYAMAGLWAALFFMIERRDRAWKRFGVTLSVLLMLFFPTSYEPEVSYLAHFTGFVLGIVSGILYFYLNRRRIRAAEIWKAPEPDEDPQFPAHLDRMPETMGDSSDPGTV